LSTAAGIRKRRGEGHTRRDEILRAAKHLFIAEGYEATTIRRIADQVGVSAPALYLYFKDKEAILLALCDRTFGFLIESMDEIARQGLPPVERLRRCGEAYIRFGLEHPDEYWLTFLSSNMAKPPGSSGAVAFARLMDVFSEIEKAGMALHHPAETSAELVWMSLHGFVSAMIRNPGFPWSRHEALIAGMIDMTVRGVVRLS
jgi:AcrR family transcriptional regulator